LLVFAVVVGVLVSTAVCHFGFFKRMRDLLFWCWCVNFNLLVRTVVGEFQFLLYSGCG
jgi:hypothetical protein